MTSTVLDVTVLLLCVSASVVALGGAEDVGSGGNVRGPTADEVADRLSTETVTVRYRAPEAANGTRTVHATRTELIALLVADGERSGVGLDSAGGRNGTDGSSFELRTRDAVVAGIGERTRIDAMVPTAATRNRPTSWSAVDRRAAEYAGGRGATGPIAVSGTPNTPRPPRRKGRTEDDSSKESDASRSAATETGAAVVIGAEPPRSADVATAVVTHPMPDGTEPGTSVRIVVRRW
ncbi:DUF7284 family protein [Halorubrum sp. HHNYT27]|uniref:DUF7284 family protein n=1 Tax=Halorubrum sp. HHNYT27 TaxID=3402275 RepID=UPI003EB73FF0